MPWGDPVRLTDFGCGEIEWAPDGGSLLCRGQEGVIRVSRNGGEVSTVDRPPGLRGFGGFRFSRDGSRLYFSAADEDGWEGLYFTISENESDIRVVDLEW